MAPMRLFSSPDAIVEILGGGRANLPYFKELGLNMPRYTTVLVRMGCREQVYLSCRLTTLAPFPGPVNTPGTGGRLTRITDSADPRIVV
jgi:hypothetical protein